MLVWLLKLAGWVVFILGLGFGLIMGALAGYNAVMVLFAGINPDYTLLVGGFVGAGIALCGVAIYWLGGKLAPPLPAPARRPTR